MHIIGRSYMRITSGSNKPLKREVTLRAGDDRRYKFIFNLQWTLIQACMGHHLMLLITRILHCRFSWMHLNYKVCNTMNHHGGWKNFLLERGFKLWFRKHRIFFCIRELSQGKKYFQNISSRNPVIARLLVPKKW